MIKSLTHAALVLALSALTVSTVQAQDADAGAKKVAQCIGCHGIPGYQASFPEVHKVPMISGQTADYIVASLEAYKKGDRKHPTMRSVAAVMSEQDMADVAAFYERQGSSTALKTVTVREPSAEVAALLAKGACASCHGADYNQPIAPNFPKIAGQHADFLYVSLRAYQVENNRQIGRNNAIMAGVANQFTLAELRQMAAYIGSLPGSLKTVPQSRFR